MRSASWESELGFPRKKLLAVKNLEDFSPPLLVAAWLEFAVTAKAALIQTIQTGPQPPAAKPKSDSVDDPLLKEDPTD